MPNFAFPEASSAVCAVVVTYHPDAAVEQNLHVLRSQVSGLAVVDNGSGPERLAALRTAAAADNFTLLENDRNLGIAAALNHGVRWAQAQGFRWVILFDQDSRVTPGFVATLERCFQAESARAKIAIVNPLYRDSRSGEIIPSPKTVGGGLEQATTSGSLMPMAVFEELGFFAEELFIDGVDYEYSLRARARGYLVRECREAVLGHAPGSPTMHWLAGRRYLVANYGPVRRYYQERNKMLLLKRYGARFFPFFWRQFVITAKDLVKIVMVETDKRRKLLFIARGMFHGVIGRSGEMPVANRAGGSKDFVVR